MSVQRQTQALLDLVAGDRRQKCDAILEGARAKANAFLAQAHADARGRMREAFREERERHDARVAAARANLQTRRRLALQQRAASFLAAAAMRLPDELACRWQSPGSRTAWVEAVVANAKPLLPRGAWHVSHAPDWPISERDAKTIELAAALGVAPTCGAIASIRAGLKIGADGNVVDGTLDGLLADRAEIGARLLNLLEAEMKP